MGDAQSGHEKTIAGILPALAGANVIYGLGILEMGITFDLAQLVMDHEIAQMILHSLQGVPVSDETLSVAVIKEMGIGKDYLSHQSTLEYMRSQSQAHLIDRRMREDWEDAGSMDMYGRAHEKVIRSWKPMNRRRFPKMLAPISVRLLRKQKKNWAYIKKERT